MIWLPGDLKIHLKRKKKIYKIEIDDELFDAIISLSVENNISKEFELNF